MNYALVTGGSRGIGRATAMKLAQSGWYVIVNCRSSIEQAEEVVELIRSQGGGAEVLPFDVSDARQVTEALKGWMEQHKGEYISLLVNNAGITDDQPMVFMTEESWHKVLNTTMDGFYNVTHALLQKMMRKRQGRIISLSSISGLRGTPGQTNYSAAKAAIVGATKALAQEVASRGITVNAVAPGFIDTDMTVNLEHKDELIKMIPVGRFGKPEEVAAVIDFLASPEAAYITGQVISVNGGLYC